MRHVIDQNCSARIQMIASTPYPPFYPYGTPVFVLIWIATIGWTLSVILGFTRPRQLVGSLVLQFAFSLQIGIISLFASVYTLGNYIAQEFAIDFTPLIRPGDPMQNSGPTLNLTELFVELSLAFKITKAGMWIFGATFLVSVLLLLARRAPRPAEQGIPPNDR